MGESFSMLPNVLKLVAIFSFSKPFKDILKQFLLEKV